MILFDSISLGSICAVYSVVLLRFFTVSLKSAMTVLPSFSGMMKASEDTDKDHSIKKTLFRQGKTLP